MTDFVKGDLVRHGEHGIGRVQEASGGDCTVYFPRREKQSLVTEDELQLPRRRWSCSNSSRASMVRLRPSMSCSGTSRIFLSARRVSPMPRGRE